MRLPFLLLFFCAQIAQARVFDFSEEHLSTYLRGTGGLSNLNKDAFGEASGASTTFEDKVDFNFSGEVGLAISYAQFTLRLGLEGLVPKELEGIEGVDGAGTVLMTLKSENLVFIPTVALEYIVFQESSARFLVGVSVGQARATMKNTYTMTADGTADLGVASYTEEAYGTALGGSIFGGIESLFTDNVTFTAEVGYRLYQIDELKHEQDAVTVNGSVTVGDPVLNSDGTARTLNLKGLYAGIGLRFYIGL